MYSDLKFRNSLQFFCSKMDFNSMLFLLIGSMLINQRFLVNNNDIFSYNTDWTSKQDQASFIEHRVYDNVSEIFGKSYYNWTAEWWKWYIPYYMIAIPHTMITDSIATKIKNILYGFFQASCSFSNAILFYT